MKNLMKLAATGAAITLAVTLAGAAQAAPNERAKKVFDFWTPERMENVQPRDLVIDHRGLGYLKRTDGSLEPYGHSVAPGLQKLRSGRDKEPNAKPPGAGGGNGGGDGGGGGSNDTTPPSITSLTPADGATIGTTQTFSAVVTDTSGLKSVDFIVSGQSFGGSFVGSDTYEVTLKVLPPGLQAAGTFRQKTTPRKAATRQPQAPIATSSTAAAAVAAAALSPVRAGALAATSRRLQGAFSTKCRNAAAGRAMCVPARR